MITPNITVKLRVPKVTNRAIPAVDNSAGVSVTKGNGGSGDLEIDVLMEGDDNHASNGEDGLARYARKQAAGTLKVYEEDGQQLPGDGGDGSEEDGEGLTSEEIDIIKGGEWFGLEGAGDPKDESEDDDASSESEDDNASSESGDEDDEGDPDFVPKLKLKGKKRKVFKATGGKKHAQKGKRDTNYMFCPLSHRLSILCLVCKHFCQHSMLCERHSQSWTPQKIHWDTVLETYYHCKANNLREVWAYLWTSWYAHGKWDLWARSSYEHAIPQKQTTMLVEALWRNFKRLVLYHYNRPCVDLATYALVTQGLPPYRVRLNWIIRDPRDGRAKCLQGEQVPIKHAWLVLRSRPTKGSYNTDVRHWLCSCGAQKYHSYLLCNHLVKELPIPSADWWATVIRWHTTPFYDVLDLLSEDQQVGAPIPAALGPRYWTGENSALLQHSSPLTASQDLVSSTHGPYLNTELLCRSPPLKRVIGLE